MSAQMDNKIKGTNAKKIRELNDLFRHNVLNEKLGKFIISREVFSLSDVDQRALIDEVMKFKNFNADNDPYGEHDFGKINFRGEKYFFKIDYYDNDLRFHSPNAADPSLTTRVLTLMKASEY
jgi:hypothetical protein